MYHRQIFIIKNVFFAIPFSYPLIFRSMNEYGSVVLIKVQTDHRSKAIDIKLERERERLREKETPLQKGEKEEKSKEGRRQRKLNFLKAKRNQNKTLYLTYCFLYILYMEII